MTVIYSIYFPASSYLVFVFVYNFVGKITMIALKCCNPYTIKAQVNMFWSQLGTGIETEKEFRERERERDTDHKKSTII